MAYDVLIRNNSTGETRRCHFDFEWFKEDDYTDLFWWTDGNYGCDCNRRATWMRAAGDEPAEGDWHCGDGGFTAIKAILADGREIPIDGELASAE